MKCHNKYTNISKEFGKNEQDMKICNDCEFITYVDGILTCKLISIEGGQNEN